MRSFQSPQPHVKLLRDLSPLKNVFLMGGFAEDALLHHAVRRQRSDLDLLIASRSWVLLKAELEEAGLSDFHPTLKGPGGTPLTFQSTEREIAVEVWLAEQAPDGLSIILPGTSEAGAPIFIRLQLPADTFDARRSTLDGLTVQTISPLALALFRATSARTRGGPEKRATDLDVLARLIRKCLLGRRPEETIPAIVELP